MNVHHLNCATMCIRGGRFISGRGGLFHPVKMVAHCLLIETEAGLVLVDTGLSTRDVQASARQLSPFFRLLTGPLTLRETAAFQVEQLGYALSDVRHIVVTHLDLDHAGGISDFPRAQIHLLDGEFRTTNQCQGMIHRFRYCPAQWHQHTHWTTYRPQGESWFGFEAVRSLSGLPPKILLIPLRGHTCGHTGVAVNTGNRWLLHAGDSYFHRDEMHPHHPTCPLGLQFFQWLLATDYKAHLNNQRRLRQLRYEQGSLLQIFSSHDAAEFETALKNQSQPNHPQQN